MFKTLYTIKFSNLKETDEILDSAKAPKLKQEDISNLNRIIVNEKCRDRWIHHTILLYFQELFQNIEAQKTFPNSCEANAILLLKPCKEKAKKNFPDEHVYVKLFKNII